MKRFALAALIVPAALAGAQDLYFSDFEANDGGLAATNDWQWGMPTGFVGGFSSTEPGSGFSGDNVWGTILGGNHNPSTISTLTLAGVDLTAATELNFWEWSDSGGNTFDMAAVLVDGVQMYLSDGDSADAWRNVSIDLTAVSGTGDIVFQFSTTSVVDRTGWYLDDVRVAGIPAPASAALLGLGGFAAARRRR